MQDLLHDYGIKIRIFVCHFGLTEVNTCKYDELIIKQKNIARLKVFKLML